MIWLAVEIANMLHKCMFMFITDYQVKFSILTLHLYKK